MAYSKEVLDHFNNPRNMGTLDKKANNVGHGLVGAPACFSGETRIAVPDTQSISLKEAYDRGTVFPVWSFNTTTKHFELKNAKAICTGTKELQKIKVTGSEIWATPDHEFFTIRNGYVQNQYIGPTTSVQSFKRVIGREGYW